jgi:integrase
MAIFKRGRVYWYEFEFSGARIRESAGNGNKDAARQIMAAHRLRLAKGEAGISERPRAPTLAEFGPRFESHIAAVCADKPATLSFYQEKLRRLLSDARIAGLRLDGIDEAVIDGYKQRRTRDESRYGRPLSPASVSRELATLRRLLRLAQEWKVLDRVPRIRLLRGERNREFVLNHDAEPDYLEKAPEPLKDVAILILESGIRPGEAVNLRWSDVYLQPAVRAKFGYIVIRGGKSRNAKRNVSLTRRQRRCSKLAAWLKIHMGFSRRHRGSANSRNIARSPARCAEASKGLRDTFVEAYDAYAAWRSRRRCFHHHADRRT